MRRTRSAICLNQSASSCRAIEKRGRTSFCARWTAVFEILRTNGILDVDITDVCNREQPCKHVCELECELMVISLSAFPIGQSGSQLTELFCQPEKRAWDTSRRIGLEISIMNETLEF